MSFTAGFKLACGVAGEPGAPYSYDTDEEQKVQDTHYGDLSFGLQDEGAGRKGSSLQVPDPGH